MGEKTGLKLLTEGREKKGEMISRIRRQGGFQGSAEPLQRN